MSDPLNFRSAFNGFNREDVVHYIDYLNASHENQIQQLQADLAAMQKETFVPRPAQDTSSDMLQDLCAQQKAALAAVSAERDDLAQRCAQNEAAMTALSAQNKELLARCTQLENTLSASIAEKEPVLSPISPMSSYVEDELAAYRRAERVEREATERARRLEQESAERIERAEREANERVSTIYRKLHSALRTSSAQATAAADNLGDLSNQVCTQLTALRETLSNTKLYMMQSLASLDEIQPPQIDA